MAVGRSGRGFGRVMDNAEIDTEDDYDDDKEASAYRD
jgi:hypothetical protein